MMLPQTWDTLAGADSAVAAMLVADLHAARMIEPEPRAVGATGLTQAGAVPRRVFG